MKTVVSIRLLVLGFVLLSFFAAETQASLTLSSGLGTTHAGNLVVNGSFEIGAAADGVHVPWDSSPYPVPPGWTGNNTNSGAAWGNDGGSPYRLSASDVLPDGRVGVNFHTVTGVLVSQPPTFNANNTVTFPATPIFTSLAGTPTVLKQVVHTELTPAPLYKMSFWVSGEEIATNQGFTGAGILGLQMSNVLAGNPTQWLVVPNGLTFGLSILYEYTFTPINSSLPVDIRFINWGSMNLTPYGMSAFGVQPILDDVIINAVPEPSCLALLAIGACGAVAARRARHRTRNRSASLLD